MTMSSMTETSPHLPHEAAWYPIASADELPFRHVFHGQLLGRELAVWRADDGNINAWENRCLHRGVRLSIGINEGAELKCQYHGWRYANRTAGCTYIPAHPADAPARRITNRTYPVAEAHGLVWSRVGEGDAAPIPAFVGDWLALRPMPVAATPEMVLTALVGARVAGNEVEALPPLGAMLELTGAPAVAALFVQPVDADRAVIRGLARGAFAEPMVALRAFNAVLTALRDRIETEASGTRLPEPIEVSYQPVSVELATMPDLVIGRRATQTVVVKRKWQAAADVVGLELAAISGALPTVQPGAHIDVHLSNGLVRQYSVTNGPGEQLSYVIGVKRDPQSRGGSALIHDSLREGDVVAISEPRNNFPLRRDALKTLLIAGGIGLTPLLSMAKALKRSGLAFELHVFARSDEHLAFREDLDALGASVVRHLELDAGETGDAIGHIVGPHAHARHLYVCGPGPMLELVLSRAHAIGWPDEAVHFEYFKNDKVIDDSSSFSIELARSALTLAVPAGRSILEVLRDNGVDAPSSCEQGACGTCLVTVLYGEPEHQDVYLNPAEKRANNCLLTCVSRARSPRLVLDI
jgi:ferredoxin-NADP reductase/nitrite reductase/ring-hydroxylating ferredoxin subunit